MPEKTKKIGITKIIRKLEKKLSKKSLKLSQQIRIRDENHGNVQKELLKFSKKIVKIIEKYSHDLKKKSTI